MSFPRLYGALGHKRQVTQKSNGLPHVSKEQTQTEAIEKQPLEKGLAR